MGPLIEVILAGQTPPPTLQSALKYINARSSFRRPGDPGGNGPDARIIVASAEADSHQGMLRLALQACRSYPVATLVLTGAPEVHMPELTGRAPITFANGISAEEMAGRLTAMCAFSESVRQYERELARQSSRAAQNADQAEELREQLRSARRLQHDLLPDASAGTFGRFSLRTLYRPAGMVSGDIYDVLAVDERRVGVALVDATGHDLAAALLSVYIIRALREMHSEPGTGAVEPDHVLARLNDELVDAELSDCQFVTASFAVCDSGTGQIRWSRGAAPHPILLRESQPPQFLRTEGGLVGAFPDRQFERATLTLEPGDRLLFYTDGLEALLLHEGGRRTTDHLADTDWFRSLRGNRLAGHFDAIEQRLDYTPPDAWPCDDVTLVAIECRE